MGNRTEQIAELYFLSNSIVFGEKAISAHLDDPNLPPSPYYAHYPEMGEPGSQYLPELFRLIGDEFYAICIQKGINARRIGAVPHGAQPLAEAHAQRYKQQFPDNLLTFEKTVDNRGKTSFIGPKGTYSPGDELVIDEDHTSGGRNKRLILATAQQAGLVVRNILTVLDRQQGGVKNLQAIGICLIPIFNTDYLLDFGVDNGYTDRNTANKIRKYARDNQL